MKEYKNLKEKAYFLIKEMIVNGQFKPNEHIEEKVLAGLINMSKTPIREAINTLEQEGWVQIVPRKGIFISEITLKDIKDIFQVRENIEPLILEMSFANLDDRRLMALREGFISNEELSQKKLDEMDHELHQYILEACNNRHIIKMMENVYEHNQRLRFLLEKTTERRESTLEEHIKILDALLAKDLEKAREETLRHIVNSQQDFLANISKFNI